MSALSGHGEIAYGNAIGSVICNAALIAAITIAVRPGRVDPKTLKTPVAFFFAAAAIYCIAAYVFGRFTRVMGIIMLATFVAYMAVNVLQMKNTPAGAQEASEEEEMPLAKTLILLVLGAVLIAVGANLLVDNGTLIAQALGVPESVIALTFVALGTSLPELVTAITSLVKGHSDLSLGNVVGANVFNLVLVSGMSITLAPFTIPQSATLFGINSSLVLDLPVMLAVMLILTVPRPRQGQAEPRPGHPAPGDLRRLLRGAVYAVKKKASSPMWTSPPTCAAPLHSAKPSTARRPAPPTRRSPPKRQNRISMPGIHFREVVCMLGIFGLFLQAAAGHILYLALHLESGSFPRPLPPDRERAAFANLQKGGAAAAQARDTLIRHNLRLVAHICKKYYAGNSAQDDMISIGTIGLIKAVDTFNPAKGKRFASYASRCIENELRMDLRRGRRTGVTLSLQEPLEADGQLTLADTLPDEADMEAGCESRADAARLRALVDALPARERAIMRQRYGFDGAPKTQQQTAQALHISRSYVSRLEKRALEYLRGRWPAE